MLDTLSSADDLFRSFWMAGDEGADHVNPSGVPLDMGALTQHVLHAEADYLALREFSIATVRESVGWRLVECDGRFDFSLLESRIEAAQRCGVQVAWTLCHYGWPDGLDIFSDTWTERFARFCRRTAEFVARSSPDIPIYTPINEISFLSWAICEMDLIHPHRGDRASEGYALKKRLVQAAMAGCDAIWDVDPRARILVVDPVIHIVAPEGRDDLAAEAQRQRSFQFQAWDMLAGRTEPALGGDKKYLDVIGVNYYHGNQWEHETHRPLYWHQRDPRRLRLRDLLAEVDDRYCRPLVISETSHVGEGRGAWIREIADDVAEAIQADIPVHGICLYPVVDRPDWHRLDHWHNSGLWDLHPAGETLERRLCEPYARDLELAQRAVQEAMSAPGHS